MCLYYNVESTRRFRREHRNDKTVTCWKVVRRTSRGSIRSLFHRSYWRPGEKRSNRRGKTVKECFVHRGIHVYTSRWAAERVADKWENKVVLPVRCKMDDLVACGRRYSYIGGCRTREAVFMKVFVRKADYERARKGKRPLKEKK